MRTYLTVGPAGELVMTCNCGVKKSLAEFVEPGVRPALIGSINLLRLMEWTGKFTSEHAACPSQPPDPKP